MTMDPRMAARRSRVAEGRAKTDLRRVMLLAAAAALVGGFIWLLTSPYMSVQRIVTYGADNSNVAAILTQEGVTEGRPLIAIRAGSVAERLEQDPWIADAAVELVFPNLVEVTVAERVGAAWIDVGQQWAQVARDGVVVGYAPAPPADAAVVRLVAPDPGLGEPLTDDLVVGAVTFVGALPAPLMPGVTIGEDGGEVWARVADRPVRLGTATDMAAKAAAVAAVVQATDGGIIDVIAPSRPAVRPGESPRDDNPQVEVESNG